MYLDSAYIAKFYLNEPDSERVRAVLASATGRVSSAWAIAEVTTTLHRKLRERFLNEEQYRELSTRFREHIDAKVWAFTPVTDRLLRRVAEEIAGLPGTAYLRSGDALHLTTAAELGEREIWSNDRHLLAAAPHFGLTGRSA
jgi:predicted nucleic acid-binding protein